MLKFAVGWKFLFAGGKFACVGYVIQIASGAGGGGCFATRNEASEKNARHKTKARNKLLTKTLHWLRRHYAYFW